MTVVATFEVLPDDKLIETLQQAKPELNNDDKALKARLKKLNEKQDPRRVEVVFYKSTVKEGDNTILGTVKAKTEHSDIWLNNLFGIKE